jgi:chromosome segregation ATPase
VIVDKLERAETTYQSKLSNLRDNLEKEYNTKMKKLEEKNRAVENEKNKLDEEFDTQKQKYLTDKRYLQDRLAETEARVRTEEKAVKAELEATIKSLIGQRDTANADLSSHLHDHHKLIKAHEVEIKAMHEQKLLVQGENSELRAKEQHYASDTAQLRKRLETTKEEMRHLEVTIENLKAEIAQHTKLRSEELDRRDKMLHERDTLITKMKDQIRQQDDELDAAEEENQIRVSLLDGR